MTNEVVDQNAPGYETGEEVQDENDQSAFEAGFASASGKEVASSTQSAVKAEVEAEAVAEVPATEEAVAEAAAEEPEIDPTYGLPTFQVKELLAKAAEVDNLRAELAHTRDRLFGHLGEVKKTMQELRQQQPQGGVKLSAASLKRLSGEYPELAELLAQDLSELPVSGGATPRAFDPSQLDPIFDQRLKQHQEVMQRQQEARWLDMLHPNWREVAASPDFKLWKQSLEPDVQKELDNSWDAAFLAQGFGAFENWRNQQAERTRTASESRKQRLTQAITPTGVPSQSSTADDLDAFMSGFNAVRGGAR
jgi:hypothetical protein